MALNPGTTLGSFEISGLIGAGGMGEVYRALDTKLGREVAIKVLPEVFAKDKDRLARFEREAKLLAALNHPNIAGIHELGHESETHFLVMELVEGRTLDQILGEGPMAAAEALPLFGQIAEALENAHDQGIVHRDLKPANIKVTDDGKVKVLDFGLAKAFAPDLAGSGSGATLALGSDSAGVTAEGRVMGTPAYMSPEQARGRPVDKRADIWAFGCCLYETLTARRPFHGETASDLMADILKSDPDWSALPAETPGRIRDLLWRCLQKDARRRLRDIGDAWFQINETQSEPSGAFPIAGTVAGGPSIRRSRLAAGGLLCAALGALIAGSLVASLNRPEPAPPVPLRKFPVAIRTSEPLTESFGIGSPAISPDGNNLVFVGRQGGVTQLYLRPIGQLTARPIGGTEGAEGPFFSPDGKEVAFYVDQQRTLKSVALGGGAAVTICRVTTAFFNGGAWGENGWILWGSSVSGLYRVRATGGEPELLTTPDSERGEIGHIHPEILPGGSAILFAAWGGGARTNAIHVLDLKTRQWTSLSESGADPRYIPAGYITYVSQGSIWSFPFDPVRLEKTGPRAQVIERVRTNSPFDQGDYDISDDGTIYYIEGGVGAGGSTLLWTDDAGGEEALPLPPGVYVFPRLSPSGDRLALLVGDAGGANIYVYDVLSGAGFPLTFEGQNIVPIWTPDGERVIFSSSRGASFDLYRKSADGSGQAELLLSNESPKYSGAVTPDGRSLIYVQMSAGDQGDIWLLPLGEAGEAERLFEGIASMTNSREWTPALSRDGKWLAYTSDQEGRNEVYVRDFPDLESQWRVSRDGGEDPVWAHDGKTLFFTLNGKIFRSSIETEPVFSSGAPQEVIDLGAPSEGPHEYDVAPDGRLLLVELGEEARVREVIVVEGWFDDLERRTAQSGN